MYYLIINVLYVIRLPNITPNNIGDGMKANKLIIIIPKPIATALSRSSTHLEYGFKIHLARNISKYPYISLYLTETKKLDALPVAPLNFNRQTTARNM